MSPQLSALLWVSLGGALGTAARFLTQQLIPASADGPRLATLVVNLAGCFLLGALVAGAPRWGMSPTLQATLGTGVMGGFTTYSTFNQEVLAAAGRGEWGRSILYGAATLIGGLIAGALGALVVRALGRSA